MKIYLLIPFFLIVFVGAFAQHRIGLPQIINYNSDQYKGGIQNWDIAQDARGIMYFGNNEGLLVFDGQYWANYPLPNATVIRSVAIDPQGRIYVGGQDELGYFWPDAHGILQYHSLVADIPEPERQFADIWNVVILGEEVFFRANTKIFHYKEGKIRVDKPQTEWQYLGIANGKLYAQALNQGILQFEHGFWKPVAYLADLEDAVVTAILPYAADTLLVATLKNGLHYLIRDQLLPKVSTLQRQFENDRIFSGLMTSDGGFILGTTSAGVLMVDRQAQHVQQYMYGAGLQKNNVRKVFLDRSKNLWLALDDGIDFIALNSAVKYIHPNKDNPVSTYAAHVHEGHLYVGTSNGLYATPIEQGVGDISLSGNKFVEVSDTQGQVWGLNEINGKLLMGHEDGAFVIDRQQRAQELYAAPGTWKFLPLSRVYPASDIIAGTYSGLQHLHYGAPGFTNGGRISGPYEPLRYLLYDGNSHAIWASHPYRGVFRFHLSPAGSQILRQKTYGDQDGLPTLLYNYIFQIKNKIMAATNQGIYEYDADSDRFVPSPLFREPFSNLEIQYLHEDKGGNVWFISHKKLGVADFSRPEGAALFSVIHFPELDGKVLGGFESVYAYDEENILIGANKGLVHLNYKRYRDNMNKPDVLLTRVQVIDRENQDRILFGGHGSSASVQPRLDYADNSFRFAFSTTLFGQQQNVEYSYQLEGFDPVWSPWSHRSEKDYTNLSPGQYTFLVKSRNSEGNESPVERFTFTIRPAWYANTVSYLLYALLFIGGFYYFFKWQQKKLKKKHEQQLYLHQLELDRVEKEVVGLRNEKLKTEIAFKNRELANTTMHLVQRGEALSKIKETIVSVVKKHDFPDTAMNFRQLMRLIRDVERTDEDWEQFSLHFNHVNEGFFTKLKESFPDLTPNELKLCAFLKLNLTTKEIAQLMNITSKGVEVGRYRLRKKLKLEPETNLYDFLLQLSVQSH